MTISLLSEVPAQTIYLRFLQHSLVRCRSSRSVQEPIQPVNLAAMYRRPKRPT